MIQTINISIERKKMKYSSFLQCSHVFETVICMQYEENILLKNSEFFLKPHFLSYGWITNNMGTPKISDPYSQK